LPVCYEYTELNIRIAEINIYLRYWLLEDPMTDSLGNILMSNWRGHFSNIPVGRNVHDTLQVNSQSQKEAH